jgi:hypothetical protein
MIGFLDNAVEPLSPGRDMDSLGRQADADFVALLAPIRGAARIHAAEDVVAGR